MIQKLLCWMGFHSEYTTQHAEYYKDGRIYKITTTIICDECRKIIK